MEELFESALLEFCTDCGGTGRDAFSEGALWCASCGGSGKRIDQLHKQGQDELLKLKLWHWRQGHPELDGEC